MPETSWLDYDCSDLRAPILLRERGGGGGVPRWAGGGGGGVGRARGAGVWGGGERETQDERHFIE